MIKFGDVFHKMIKFGDVCHKMIKFGNVCQKMIKFGDDCHKMIKFDDVCHNMIKFEPEELGERLEVLIFRLAQLGPPALSTKLAFLISGCYWSILRS